MKKGFTLCEGEEYYLKLAKGRDIQLRCKDKSISE
jgi:hypothetical protein